MSDEDTKEQLSCLLDDALDGQRARFLARRLVNDGELRGCWQRYHLVGDVLRAQRSPGGSRLAARVAQALAGEAPPATATGRMPGWLKPAAGLAVAASVAVAVFTTLQAPDSPGSVPEPARVAERAPFEAGPAVTPRPGLASGVSLNQARAISDPRLQSYLLRHNEAATRRGQGLVPYIYLVTAPEPATAEAVSDAEAVRGD